VSLRHPFRIFRDDDWRFALLAVALFPVVFVVDLATKYRRWRGP
jgi:hypothetical protein